MSFTSFEFVVFFLAVVLMAACVRGGSAEKWLLLAASVCFYLSWSAPCVVLILFTSFFDYSIARKMGKTANPVRRKWLLILSMATNLGMLGFFKYTNFLLENVFGLFSAVGWHNKWPHYDIILPPAISYFTFASMSYMLDVYYERLSPCESARDYALFVTFFPKVLSGPIVRASEFLPQLKVRARPTAKDIEAGLILFLVGAVKKLVIADQVAGNVNLIFSAPAQYDGLTLLQGLLGYAVQMYCDFSGYTDMACGCARILGFRFPENFQMPFSSLTITEYWRRWHITLSQWFRDYVFLPLEIATRSNPNPVARVSINMMITMLLCGLWHGASWNFVIWGGIHGAALALHKAWTVWKPLASLKDNAIFQPIWTWLARALTLGVVLLGWIFFRATTFSDAASYLGRMISWSHGTRLVSPYILAAVAVVLLVHLIIDKDRNLPLEAPEKPWPRRAIAYACMLTLLALFGATDSAPFIYFQF
jgi:alginate O-acetyltransferase complex protein AlgI